LRTNAVAVCVIERAGTSFCPSVNPTDVIFPFPYHSFINNQS
jgi:hypothetical protein